MRITINFLDRRRLAMPESFELLTQYGVTVLFVVIFAEQLGLPLPALPLLVAAGVLIGTGHLPWIDALTAALLATVLADGLWYVAGQWRGRSVLTILCRLALEPASCIRRTETFFRKHGGSTLVLAKFIPGLSTIAPPLAGIMGVRLSSFVFYDGLGTVLWVGSGLGLGYLFADRIEQGLFYAGQVTPVLVLAMVIGVFGYLVHKAVDGRRSLRLVPRITAGDLAHRLEGDSPPLLIDVRSREVFDAEPGLPGAVNIPPEELNRHLGTIPPNRDLVLYCACPGDVSSAFVAGVLRRREFNRVWVLNGGLTAWRVHTGSGLTHKCAPVESLATS